MKKYIYMLCLVLCSLLPCNTFASENNLKQLDKGNFNTANMYISLWNDYSIRITDGTKQQFIFHVLDDKTLDKASKVLKSFLEENKIISIKELVAFFDKNNIKYTYESFEDSSNLYVSSQSFLEDFLVPLYGLPSGFNNDDKFFMSDWDKENGYYKNAKNIYSDHVTNFFSFNGKYYESQKITYSNNTVEVYSDFDINKNSYQKMEHTAMDGSSCIFTVYNNDGYWENQTIEDQNGVITNYFAFNKDSGIYENKKVTYPSGIIEYYSDLQEITMKNNERAKYYFYEKKVYEDYYVEKHYADWNSEYEIFDSIKITSSNLRKERSSHFFNYDTSLKDYKNKVFVYENRTVKYFNPDSTGYYEIEVFDNNNNLISYLHVTKEWDGNKRDIQVLSDNIVYDYKGVSEISKDYLIQLDSFEYIDEKGTEHKIKNQKLKYWNVYKKLLDLL